MERRTTLMWFANMCILAEDSNWKRIPAAVGDRLPDQRVVRHHPERH